MENKKPLRAEWKTNKLYNMGSSLASNLHHCSSMALKSYL